jgi:hypothetical protein
VFGDLVVVRLGSKHLTQCFDGLLRFGQLAAAFPGQGVDGAQVIDQRAPDPAVGVRYEGCAPLGIVPVERLEQAEKANVFEVLPRSEGMIGNVESAYQGSN